MSFQGKMFLWSKTIFCLFSHARFPQVANYISISCLSDKSRQSSPCLELWGRAWKASKPVITFINLPEVQQAVSQTSCNPSLLLLFAMGYGWGKESWVKGRAMGRLSISFRVYEHTLGHTLHSLGSLGVCGSMFRALLLFALSNHFDPLFVFFLVQFVSSELFAPAGNSGLWESVSVANPSTSGFVAVCLQFIVLSPLL